ncbi:MAG TPA: hypothetical protein VFT12_06310 [Thermoanaerobaculia bacterium]|nr:hypothetical protein [Thermoanaerobaculia bacterium]
MTTKELMQWIKTRRVVLESGSGPVPNVATFIAGEEIRGNWWSHPKAGEIFRLTRAVRDSPDVLVARLVGNKITFVHKNAWPALVRLASRFSTRALARLEEQHTAKGRHKIVTTPFPRWVPPEIKAKAGALTDAAAERTLGEWAAARRSSAASLS